MTPKEADKLITAGKLIVIVNSYGDHAMIRLVERDRRCIYTQCGMVLDRTDIPEWHPL